MAAHKNLLFVVFGITGDLAQKKLIPAIYHLLSNRKVKNVAVIGNGRKALSADALLRRSLPYIEGLDKRTWRRLRERFYYERGDIHDEENVKALQDRIIRVEKKHGLSGNRLFYLAIMPEHFPAVVSSLERIGLAGEEGGWTRVAFEKPFGGNLRSAQRIDRLVTKVFREEQIFRIDHYLGKELVQNISSLRFTNAILEPLWNRTFIDHVQLILSEDAGIDERGATYDETGALKDVVQNHMLQLLSLVAMEAPSSLDAPHVRDAKVNVLKKVRIEDMALGQYRGYAKERGIRKGSKTETLAALKLFVRNDRWKGVPFYLLTGKKMKTRLTCAYIQFKAPPCSMFERVCAFLPNHLVIQIQPNEGFYLQINAKAPGRQKIRPVSMDFCHRCVFGPNTPEAYENLLSDVINRDQSAFVRSDEIEAAWRIIDRALRNKLEVRPYRKKEVPPDARKLIEKDGRYWHLETRLLRS
jgi:glucose-6-phosphate 1-dehydrogenase